MNLTWFGHACFLAEVGGKKLLFDPFISGNDKASHINVDEIEADYILLSHGHIDHILDAESIAKRTGATIIANYEVGEYFVSKGCDKVHHLNHGGTFIDDTLSIKYVNAVHTSALPDGSNGGNPGGFVVHSTEDPQSFYFAGDTALTYDMKLIADYTPVRLAILPIGGTFTMDYKDAFIASDFVECTRVIGMHYDTFPPIEINKAEVDKYFDDRDKKIFLPEIGETLSF